MTSRKKSRKLPPVCLELYITLTLALAVDASIDETKPFDLNAGPVPLPIIAPLTTLRLSPLASVLPPPPPLARHNLVHVGGDVPPRHPSLRRPAFPTGGGGVVVTHRYRCCHSGGRFPRPCRARRRGLEAVEGLGVGRAREGRRGTAKSKRGRTPCMCGGAPLL